MNGIVNDRCEEVDGEYQGDTIVQTVDGSVVTVFETYQQIGMWCGSIHQPAQHLGEFALAQFARSAGAAGEFRQPRDLLIHVRAPSNVGQYELGPIQPTSEFNGTVATFLAINHLTHQRGSDAGAAMA